MTTTECQMLDCMGEVRHNKRWLEASTKKCFKSWRGTFWSPAMMLGGWLGVYKYITYRLLLITLGATLVDSIVLGWSVYIKEYTMAGVFGLFLAYPLYILLTFKIEYARGNIAWLAAQHKVLRSCVAHHAAHPSFKGFKDAEMLLEHVEDWLRRFAYLIDEDEESLQLSNNAGLCVAV